MNRARGSKTLLAAAGFVAATCAPPAGEVPVGNELIIDIEAVADPGRNQLEIVEAFGRTAQGLVPIRIVQDGLPGRGPPNSVELVTETTGFDDACGYPSSYCGSVRLRSFYTAPLDDVFVQLTSITPFEGHEPLNSDPTQPQLGINMNRYGLWAYRTLQADGGNNARLWVFHDDGQPFRFRGRVRANIVREGRLLAITGSGGSPSALYRVDELDGRAVLIGTTGLTHLGGIDVDPTNGLVYAHRNTFKDPQALYRIDPTNGASTLVGATGIQAPDMTFDAAGRLFAWVSQVTGASAVDDLAEIDKETGVVRMIPVVLDAAQTGLFTQADGHMIVKNGNTLYGIDPDLGAVTLIGVINGLPGRAHNAADVDPTTGLLYVVVRSDRGTDLYRVDLSSRSATLVGPIMDGATPLMNVSGLAFR